MKPNDNAESSAAAGDPVYNWFPGHMKKTLGRIGAVIGAIDVILEVRDARAPMSCSNPLLSEIFGEKNRIVLLHKAALADPKNVRKWIRYFEKNNLTALATDKAFKHCRGEVLRELKKRKADKERKFAAKGMRPPPVRALVAGFPNTGKSSLINILARRKSTQTGDKPGVTKQPDWVRLDFFAELLDTPGVFLMKPDNAETSFKLALVHCIRGERVHFEALNAWLMRFLLTEKQPDLQRFADLPFPPDEASQIQMNLTLAKQKTGRLIEKERLFRKVVREFQEGKYGRYCLERAENFEPTPAESDGQNQTGPEKRSPPPH